MNDKMRKNIHSIFHFRVPNSNCEQSLLAIKLTIESKKYYTFVKSNDVYPCGGATAVLTKQGNVGITLCSSKDNYEKKRGYKIAYDFAMNKPSLILDIEYYHSAGYMKSYMDIHKIALSERLQVPERIRTDKFYPVYKT